MESGGGFRWGSSGGESSTPTLTPLGKKLHAACKRGDVGEVIQLLNDGADPMEVHDWNTPLHTAANANCIEIVDVLLRRGDVDWRKTNISGMTAFHIAASKGNVKMMQLLLDRGVDVEGGAEFMTTSPLALACFQGHYEAAAFLLDRGANPNAMCEKRFINPPLYHACTEQREAIVELLLSRGADANLYRSNSPSSSALRITCGTGNLAIFKMLLRAGAHVTGVESAALHAACITDRPEMAAQLIQLGANVNFIDDMGRFVLEAARWAGNLDTLHLLLSSGAEPMRTGERRRTPLQGSSEKNGPLVTMLLLQAIPTFFSPFV